MIVRIRISQYVLVAAGTLALGYCAAVWIGARSYQDLEAREFGLALRSRSQPAAAVRGRAPIFRAGGLIGKLEIPRLGLSAMIVEGVDGRDLRRAVGHIPGTALPGQPGNIAIAGHRDTFFRPLRNIRPNDTITLSTVQGDYRYHVVSTKVVAPNDAEVLDPTGQDTLTLVTCYPFYYLGPAPKRYVVQAARLSGQDL
jgi:sortase A